MDLAVTCNYFKISTIIWLLLKQTEILRNFSMFSLNVYVLCPVIVVQKRVLFNYSRRRICASFFDSTGGKIKDGFLIVASCPPLPPEITDVVEAWAYTHPHTTKRCIIGVCYCAQMYTHRAYNIMFCRSPKTFFCREHLSKTIQRVGYKGVEPEKQWKKKTLGDLLRGTTRHTRTILGVANGCDD